MLIFCHIGDLLKEGTLNELCDEIITSQLGSPQLIEEHHQLQEQWHGFQAPLRTLLDPDATPDEYRQAQDYLIVNGPLMADGADQLIEALHLQVDHRVPPGLYRLR